jgi:polyisoprenyl-phosphate glycosyltransferase
MMDSDLQHPPSLIPQLLQGYEAGNDIVNTVREDVKNIGFFKRVSSRLFYSFMNNISEVPIGENAPDFRLITARVARVIREEARERNFFLRGIIPWLGFNQSSVRFVAAPRPGGESKYSVSRLMALGISGVVSFSRKPLRVTFFLGVALLVLDVCAGAVGVVNFLVAQHMPSRLSVILLVLVLFFSIQFIFLGIIGEYIGAIFEEVKKRPRYIVDEKINL